MRTDMERREAGEKIIREMMGEETAGRLLAVRSSSHPLLAHFLPWIFGPLD
jgi:hypothetical protein